MASPLVHVDAKPRGLPDEIGDKQARQALPIASHSLSRSGRRRGRQNMGKVGQFMRFPEGAAGLV